MGCQRDEPAAAAPLALLRAGAAVVDLALDASALAAFQRYSELLRERGATVNLTGIRDYEGVQRRHFLESLALGVALRDAGRLNGDEAVLDVGSGAGFPGIPLRLAWPGLRVTLLEATEKKAAFLQLVVDTLELSGVRVVTARAEEAAHRLGLRSRFDLVAARAVAATAALSELTLPFARIGGVVAAVKGSRLDQELPAAAGAIALCGGGNARELRWPVSGPEPRPRLLVIDKLHETPRHLPRRPGLPAHSPLR